MNLFNRLLFIIPLVIILLLGFYIRSHNLYTWPRLGATFDEYAWTWQGISLIKTGIPTSWSYHPQYKNRDVTIYQKTNFILVTPYLEHPPLFGLVAGGYAMLNGAKDIFEVDLHKIRGLAVILGLLSIFLVYVLARINYGEKIGLLSAFLYSIIPTVAVGSRIVQNENFFIPMWLLSLILSSLYLNNKKTWMRNLAAVIAGLLILAKIPWVAAAFSLVIIYLFHKKYKDILISLTIIIPIAVVYLLYGLYYDKEIFIGLWGLQLNRYDITFSSIYALFQKPYLADRFYLDGWIYWGWFSFVLLLMGQFKKNIVLVSAVLSYFLIFLAGIPDEAGHGWYRYPFYPFLAISIALFIKEFFTKNYILTFLFLVFIGTALLETVWKVKFGFSYPIFRLAIVSWGLVLIPRYINKPKFVILGKVVAYLWFFILIVLSIKAGLNYNEM